MTELLTVKVRLPTDRSDQGNYTIESMDSADEGRYYCRAANSLGTDEASVQVSMLGTPLLLLLCPIVIGPIPWAIAVPSVTRCRCRRGHRCAGGARQYR